MILETDESNQNNNKDDNSRSMRFVENEVAFKPVVINNTTTTDQRVSEEFTHPNLHLSEMSGNAEINSRLSGFNR